MCCSLGTALLRSVAVLLTLSHPALHVLPQTRNVKPEIDHGYTSFTLQTDNKHILSVAWTIHLSARIIALLAAFWDTMGAFRWYVCE